MDAVIERELLSVVQDLSPREVRLVIDYARALHSTPISDLGRTYLDILAQDGAPPTELLRAAQAVQRVEERLVQRDPQAQLYDLEQRTQEHIRSWFRERGVDYKAATEEQFDDIVAEVVRRRKPQ
jgi:hypothetical protein